MPWFTTGGVCQLPMLIVQRSNVTLKLSPTWVESTKSTIFFLRSKGSFFGIPAPVLALLMLFTACACLQTFLKWLFPSNVASGWRSLCSPVWWLLCEVFLGVVDWNLLLGVDSDRGGWSEFLRVRGLCLASPAWVLASSLAFGTLLSSVFKSGRKTWLECRSRPLGEDVKTFVLWAAHVKDP